MSSGFRNNIDPYIQAGLEARVSASSGFGDQSVNIMKNPLLGSVSTEFIDSEGRHGGVVFSKKGQIGKSIYVRMIAAGEKRTDVIYGLFNPEMGRLKDDSEHSYNTFGEMTDMVTGGPEEMYYDLQKSSGNQYKRFGPSAAGIKTITCEFLSAGRSGAAVRKATVNWVCWSLNDLEKYQVGSFMSPGRTVILDWGWVRADKGSVSEPPAILKGTATSPYLNKEIFKRTERRNGTRNPSAWDTLQRDYYGDWDGIVGKVVKFDWKQRDDGAFDCTTELIGQGSNVYDSQILPSDDKTPHVPPIGTFNLEKVLKDVYKDLDDGKLTDRIQKAPALNISERIALLDIELLRKYKSDIVHNDNNEYIEHSIDPIVTMPADKSFVTIIYPYQRPAAEGEKPEDVPYIIEPIQENEKTGELRRSSHFRSEVWINWGWFEDNIVSYYGRNIVALEKGESAKFRSVMWNKDTKQYESIKITNRKSSLFTWTKNFIFPGQFPIEWHPQTMGPPNDEGVVQKNPYRMLAEAINTCRPFDDGGNPDPGDTGKGYIRNIYVNLDAIKSAFHTPGASIASAMLNLAKQLDGGMGIWNFKINRVSEGVGTTKDGDLEYQAPIVGISEDNSQEKKDDNDPAKSFIFENYGLNSLVKDISMSTSISSRFITAMAIGARRGDLSEDPLVTALGRKKKDSLDIDAEGLGLFYSDPANRDKIATLFSPSSRNEADEALFDFYGNSLAAVGNPDSVSNNGYAHSITADGLSSGTEGQITFNHAIDDLLIKLTPTARDNFAKSLTKRFEDVGRMGVGAIDVKKITKKDLAVEAAKLKMIAFPPDKIVGSKYDPNAYAVKNKDLNMEFQLPYDTSMGMRPQYMKTLRWYNSENHMTRLLSIKPDYKQFPITIDMTIEGCGGILPRDIFRLAYLPETYGQTDTDVPKTYFHILNVTHNISDSGWSTQVSAYTAGNDNAIKAEKAAMLKEQGVTEKDIRIAIEKSFSENLRLSVPGVVGPPEPAGEQTQGAYRPPSGQGGRMY